MLSVVLYVAVQVSMETIVFLGSTTFTGAAESRIGSKGGCGGEEGRFTGRAGTGGKLSNTFNDGRILGEEFGSTGVGGTARVGREGVLHLEGVGRSSSSSSSGSGGSGGLPGEASSVSSSSKILGSGVCIRSPSDSESLGPANAS